MKRSLGVVATCLMLGGVGCVPSLAQKPRAPNKTVPDSFGGSPGGASSAQVPWNQFFSDSHLSQLISTALQNNQELNIVSREIDISKNEIQTRQGDFLPKLNFRAGAGIEKVGRDTSQGVSDELHGVRENLPEFGFGLGASWEVDIWGKLRSATKAATLRYLASVEGRNFTVTVLVGEIANSYYELMALDVQLEVLRQNVEIQKNALAVVRLQKEAGRVTELAVRRFEAEVLKNESRQYAISQQIVEMENRINFLVGRFPQRVDRESKNFTALVPATIQVGIPSQLLDNRPDVKRAELDLVAAELDVKVARASFYPSLEIEAAVGYQAFDFLRLVTTPASLFYHAAANTVVPLLNRKAIKANYLSANAKQMQAVFNYERTILKGYTEAANQLAMIQNLEKSYGLRSQEVEKLNESITISSGLFQSARADYMEVLMTRRDALEAQMELIETKKKQLNAVVNLYQSLGGGWR